MPRGLTRALLWSAAGAGALVAAGALFSRDRGRALAGRVPAEGAFVEAGGARLHYVEAGDGPPVVLLHGLGGQLRNFSYALLDRLAATHRVILLDRPGAGFSSRVAGRRTGIVEHAGVVAAFLEARRIERPLVVGHSLGGAVALALALDHPGLIERLALIAPLSQPEIVMHPLFRRLLAAPPVVREAASATLAVPLGAVIRHRVHGATFAPEAIVEDFDVRGGGLLALRSGALAAGLDEIATASAQLARLAPRYGEIDLPVSILFGRDDRVLDPAIHGARTAAAIVGARLELIDGGHMLPLTQPDATARFIRAA